MSRITDEAIERLDSRINHIEKENKELKSLLYHFFRLLDEKEYSELKKEAGWFKTRL